MIRRTNLGFFLLFLLLRTLRGLHLLLDFGLLILKRRKELSEQTRTLRYVILLRCLSLRTIGLVITDRDKGLLTGLTSSFAGSSAAASAAGSTAVGVGSTAGVS
jgi:hypothetical protein